MANEIADDSKNLDDVVQQEIITPLKNKVDDLDSDLIEKEKTLKTLDETIQLKLGRCQDILNKNTGTVYKYLKIFGTVFIVSGLASIGIWIALGVDKSVDWIISNQSFSTTSKVIYLLGFVVLFVLVSTISVICFYHFVIRKQYENSFSEIKMNSIDPEKKGIKKIVEDFNVSAKGAEGFFRSKISLVESVNAEIKSDREWYLKCEKMLMVITFFGLQEYLENTIVDLKKNPPDNSINKTIIDHVCEKAPFNLTLMNLLVSYYDGKSNNVASYWKTVKTDKKLIGQVARIIWKLNIFNLYENLDNLDEELNEDDLKLILSKTQKFEQSLITNNVLLYLKIYNFLLNYRGKLAKESGKSSEENIKKINLKKQLTNEEIIDNIDFSDDFVTNFIDIFSKELHQYLNIDFKDAYVDALMAILLNPDINFRDQVCKRASNNNETIYVLIAYYNLRKKKGETNEQFFLFDIFDEAEKPSIIKKKIEDGDHLTELLFKRLNSALLKGEWYESSQTIMQSMVEEILGKLDKDEKNKTLIRIFAKYFTRININTLDRAVDAGLFTIYLILVPPTKGNFLPKVIDRLTVQEHEEKNEEEKIIKVQKVHYETTRSGDSTRSFDTKKIEKFKTDYGVSLLLDPHTPKYDFEDYSVATRIGILHNTTPFLTFIDSFNKDVEMVLRKEVEINPNAKWENITFIILRISPSKHSFGLMNDYIENMDRVKFSNNLVLANKIARLASPYLTEQQKTAVATFENDITLDNFFEQMTLFDFMSVNMQILYENEKTYGGLLKSPDLMFSIKEHLKTCNIESFRRLSTRLFRYPEKQNELKKSLSLIIAKEYKKPKYKKTRNQEISEDIIDEFVSEFLDSMKTLYEMWNHEAFK